MKRVILKFLILLSISILLTAASVFIYFNIINRFKHPHIELCGILAFYFFPVVAILIGIIGYFITKIIWMPTAVSTLIFSIISIISSTMRGIGIIAVILTMCSSGLTYLTVELIKENRKTALR